MKTITYQFSVYFKNGTSRNMYLVDDREYARHFEMSYQTDSRVAKVIRTFVDSKKIVTSQMKKVTSKSKSNRLTYYVDNRNLIK